MILVTGASGNIGRPLLSLLSAQGIAVRAVTRNERKLSHLPVSIDRVIGDFRDKAFIHRSPQGVKKLFLLPLFGKADQMLIDEAADLGVEQVVMISTLAPEETIIGQMHLETESRLMASDMQWTILRGGAFMSNVFAWIPSIRAKGEVHTPIGNGLLAPIAPKDMAKATQVALLASGHEGKIYALTGAELLSTRDQIAILARVLGKSIRRVDISLETMAAGMTKNGVSRRMVDGVGEQMSLIREGRTPLISDDFQELTRATPQTFGNWCLEFREVFL